MDLTKRPQARIAVNSRCGRACFFCRPSGEAVATSAGTALDIDTVVRVCHELKLQGITEFKLTGGDPALWEPLADCVRRLRVEVGASGLEVISRHPRIGARAKELREAGLERINLSIDSLKPEIHQRVTGVDDLTDVLAALTQCVSLGFDCKVNTVVMHGVNDGELSGLVDFCERNGVSVLKLLDVIRDLEDGTETFKSRLAVVGLSSLRSLYASLERIRTELECRAVETTMVVQGGLGHPMTAFRLPSGLTVLLKDHRAGAWYAEHCATCRHYPCHDALMAIRLTPDCRLQFCLLRHDICVDIRRAVDDIDGGPLRTAIAAALSVYHSAVFAAGTTPCC